MIKRIFTVFIAVSLLASPLTAMADAVMGNEFRHKNEKDVLELDRRRFIVNGTDGYIIVKDKPGLANDIVNYLQEQWPGVKDDPDYIRECITYKNGEMVVIDGLFIDDGEYWGAMSIGHGVSYPGWIPMDQLLVDYTSVDFENENKDEYYEYTGNFDAVFAAKRIVLWQWPGSDREKRVLDNKDFVLKDVISQRAYKDSFGREWGYVKLDYNNVAQNAYVSTPSYEGWICLSEPDNSNIPTFNPSALPTKWSPDGVYEWTHVSVVDDTSLQYLLSNITKISEYKPNKTFTDIQENDWYKSAVSTAYEYGIIEGWDNKFDPNSEMTLGEALVIASRIHAYYKYGKDNGEKVITMYNQPYMGGRGWLIGTIEYCKVEGIINGKDSDNYYSIATRAQMVHFWSKILQSKDMEKQNTVKSLPDVSSDKDYSADIFAFYEAGILSGIDDKGTFNPNGNITRAEAATIFMNLIEVNKRHSGRTY